MTGIRPSWSCIRGLRQALLLVPGKIFGTGSPTPWSSGPHRPRGVGQNGQHACLWTVGSLGGGREGLARLFPLARNPLLEHHPGVRALVGQVASGLLGSREASPGRAALSLAPMPTPQLGARASALKAKTPPTAALSCPVTGITRPASLVLWPRMVTALALWARAGRGS